MKPALALAVLAAAAFGQPGPQDAQFREAGVCARCHVISVVEWGMSAHRRASTGCETCHGASAGHVIDERNNVKPERVPKGAAIAGLCATCHTGGCPKSKAKDDCQTCHHVHALVDPRKPALAPPPEPPPAAPRPAPQLSAPLAPWLSVAGLSTRLILVPGGEANLGSERFPRSRPVHTVPVRPFYLAESEVTQAEWKSVMGSNPSARQGDDLPVDSVSWRDAQEFLARLSERAPGLRLRLPTEAEWEHAARSASALGLRGMLSGVSEWCSSLDRPYPYDPRDGREDPAAAGLRVIRGASDLDSHLWSDPALRHGERPERRLAANGLRVAASVR